MVLTNLSQEFDFLYAFMVGSFLLKTNSLVYNLAYSDTKKICIRNYSLYNYLIQINIPSCLKCSE